MYLARQRSQWQHTAPLLAELMNGPRQRRDKQAWKAEHLDPFARTLATVSEEVTPSELVSTALSVFL